MKRNKKDYFSDDLRNTNWLGEVVLNEDSENLGRIKVKVFGKFDLLEEEHIPWARCGNFSSAGSTTGSGFFSVPKVGSVVSVYFDNGNIYSPVYTFHQKPSDELIEEIGDEHQNFHSLIYDTEIENSLKIFYSTNEEKGLIINLKDTTINIRNDNEIKITNPNEDTISLKNDGTLEITTSESITINTKATTINSEDTVEVNTKEAVINTKLSVVNASDSAVITTPNAKIESGKIELGNSANEQIVLGNSFMTYFNMHVHMGGAGNLGAPLLTGPPLIPMDPAKLSSITKSQ